ncbi:MAG: NACHT domain-containing protein, partial [Planctomycetaceae bacterium]|nr:NACHT domain-containing protein [Planctomycetaceae bacterium]
IQQYVFDEKTNRPLVIVGRPGSGKTAVLARAWLNIRGSASQLIPAARFIGATPDSSELPALLSGICRQLNDALGKSRPIPTQFSELTKEFHALLTTPPEDAAIVIFLDALDQLNPTEDAQSLHWLPLGEELPARVKLIVSVSELDSNRAYQQVRRFFASDQLKLPLLSSQDGDALLTMWLTASGRKLQPEQRQRVLDGFAACQSPLYLKLAAQEALNWSSFTEIHQSSVPRDVKGLLSDVFDRLEKPQHHGKMLVNRTFACLAASRRGLSEMEIIKALSSDGELMEEYRRRAPDSPIAPQLPFVVWSRLHAELQSFLTVRSYQGTSLIDFYHRDVSEVVRSRYLDSGDRARAHLALVRFFGSQTVVTNSADTVSGRRAAVNNRYTDEYPWQLVAAATSGAVECKAKLEELLTDLSFVEAKCLVGALYDLEADYIRAFTIIDQDRDESRLALMRQYASSIVDFVRQHRRESEEGDRVGDASPMCRPFPQLPLAQASEFGPNGLATKSRLAQFAQFVSTHSHKLQDYPYETAQFAQRYPSGQSVVDEATRLSGARRLVEFDIEPSLPNTDLSGRWLRTLRHDAKSVAIDATGRFGVTAGGRSGSVRFWDLVTGAPVRITNEHHDDIDHVAMTLDGRIGVSGGGTWSILATGGTMDGMNVLAPIMGHDGRPMKITPDYSLRIWDAEVGECTGILQGHTDAVEAVVLSADGAIVVSAGRDHTIRHWHTRSGRCLRVIHNALLINTMSLDAFGRICVGTCSNGRLHCWEVGTQNWKVIQPPSGQSYQAAKVTPDGKFLAAVTKQELFVWELGRDEPVAHRTFTEEFDKTFCLSPEGRYFFGSVKKQDLLIFDLHDGVTKPRRISGAGSEHAIAVTPDGRFLLNSSHGETRLWDLAVVPETQDVASQQDGFSLGPKIVSCNGARIVHTKSDASEAISLVLPPKGDDAAGKEPRRVPLASSARKGESKAAFLSAGSRLATLDPERGVELWNTQDGSRLAALGAEKPSHLVAGEQSNRFAFVSGEKEIHVHDGENGPILRFNDHVHSIGAVGLSQDGSVAVSVGGKEATLSDNDKNDGDFELRVWDLRTGRLRHKLNKFPVRAECVVLDRHGWGAATVSHEILSSGGFLEFWDLEFGLRRGGQLVAPILLGGSLALDFIHNVDVAPDGGTFVVGAFNNQMKHVQIYHSCTQQCESLLSSDLLFSRVAFARSGRIVVGDAWGSGQLRVWDFVSGDLFAVCDAPPDDGSGDFGWIDGETGTCICPGRNGEFHTLGARNLPPPRLSLGELLGDLAAENPRRRLAALWYAIEHPPVAGNSSNRNVAFYNRLLDIMCDTSDGSLTEVLRHAAAKAALRSGRDILSHAVEKLMKEESWQGVGELALLVGALADHQTSPVAIKALSHAAAHPDGRVRKRVALVLDRYHSSSSANAILEDLRKSDPVVAEFINLVKRGFGDFRHLDRSNYNAERSDGDFTTVICPTSESELQATNDLFGVGLKKLHKVGCTVVTGGSHAWLELLLLKQFAAQALDAQDHDRLAQLQREIELLEKAHQFPHECPRKHRHYFERLAALKCVCIPVKRVLAGLIRDSLEDEKLEYLLKCVEYVEAGYESLAEPRFVMLRDQMQGIEDERRLMELLGVRGIEGMRVGMGPSSWREYANIVSYDAPRLLYCLINEFIQSLYDFWIGQQKDASKWKPRPQAHVMAEGLIADLGGKERVAALRELYERLFGVVDPFVNVSTFFREMKFSPLLGDDAVRAISEPVVTEPLSETAQRNRSVDWTRYSAAVEHWRNNRLREALLELDGLMTALQEVDNHLAATLVALEIAVILEQAGVPKGAMHYFDEVGRVLAEVPAQSDAMIASLHTRQLMGQFITLRKHHLDDERMLELVKEEFASATSAGNETALLWGNELLRALACRGAFEEIIQTCKAIPGDKMKRFLELDRATQSLDRAELRAGLQNRALALGAENHMGQLAEWCEEMVEVAQEAHQPVLVLIALLRFATVLANNGVFAKACQPLGEAILKARDAEVPWLYREALALRGEIAIAEEDWGALEKISGELDKAVQMDPGTGPGAEQCARKFRAIGMRQNDKLDEARELWDEILRVAEQQEDGVTKTLALAYLGGLDIPTEGSPQNVHGASLLEAIDDISVQDAGRGLQRVYRQLGQAWPEFAGEFARMLLADAKAAGSRGNYELAAEIHEVAVLITPDDPSILNQAAWFFATCPMDGIREGTRALLLAEKACKITGWREWALVDTVGAAFAELGKFSRAVETAKKALDLAPDENASAQTEEALKRYRQGLPMREPDLAVASGIAGRCNAQQLEMLSAAGYPIEAYDFLMDGLEFAVDKFRTEQGTKTQDSANPTHITAEVLCLGLCDLAKARFGLDAQEQLRDWNITRTDDFGAMTFTLVKAGLMTATEEDRPEQFDGLFKFEDVFDLRN